MKTHGAMGGSARLFLMGSAIVSGSGQEKEMSWDTEKEAVVEPCDRRTVDVGGRNGRRKGKFGLKKRSGVEIDEGAPVLVGKAKSSVVAGRSRLVVQQCKKC